MSPRGSLSDADHEQSVTAVMYSAQISALAALTSSLVLRKLSRKHRKVEVVWSSTSAKKVEH